MGAKSGDLVNYNGRRGTTGIFLDPKNLCMESAKCAGAKSMT